MPKEPVLVLLSGGLDSTVSLATVMNDPTKEVLRCIAFDYGQRSWVKEQQAVRQISAHYHLPLQTIKLDWLKALVPEGYSPEFKGIATHLTDVWVPNRNGVMLNIAASIAESIGANAIAFGANLDEADAGFPDNGEEFWHLLNQCFKRSTLKGIKVWAPVGDLRKTDIVRRGVRLQAPLNLIWSCYGNGALHCGHCSSCLHLKRGLAHLGEASPLRFAEHHDAYHA
ncbi:MAG: 7-cyano-7-deazaguanine synthase [Vampirovibrio sp.]